MKGDSKRKEDQAKHCDERKKQKGKTNKETEENGDKNEQVEEIRHQGEDEEIKDRDENIVHKKGEKEKERLPHSATSTKWLSYWEGLEGEKKKKSKILKDKKLDQHHHPSTNRFG
ncbi:hypothetical protein J6590_049819 [Homalodisca vitripennis]|nr:hypothetical protein J6590_049819 [Homalodisca vitripennis]